MQTISIELTDEQMEKIKQLNLSQIEAAGVAGGAALTWAVSALAGYAMGKMLDSISNASPDISGRQVSDFYSAA